MSMQYVREAYGVPAKRGRIVEVYYEGALRHRGRITSATNYIVVNGRNHHPTYEVVYFDDDGLTVLMDTRKSK